MEGQWLEVVSTFALTGVMELGDASSLYLLGLSLTSPRFSVYLGGIFAQLIVTATAVSFGNLLPADATFMSLLSTCIFLCFAAYSAYTAYHLSSSSLPGLSDYNSLSEKSLPTPKNTSLEGLWKALVGTLVSEIGGKSQLMTCALVAKMSAWSVFVGAVLGVSFTMGVFLYCSHFVADYLSPYRAYVGSTVLFTLSALVSVAGY